MADVYNNILSYIENEYEDYFMGKYQELISCINTKQIIYNKEEFKTIIRIISNI